MINQTHFINNKEYTHLELQEKFNIPNNVEVVGVNIVATDADELIKREKCFDVWRQFPIDGISYQTYSKIYENLFTISLNDIETGFDHLSSSLLIFDENLVSKVFLEEIIGKSSAEKWTKGLNSYRNKPLGIDKVVKMLSIDGCGTSTSLEFAHYLSNNPHDFSGKTKLIIEKLKNSNDRIDFVIRTLSSLANIKVKYLDRRIVKEITEDTVTYVMTGRPQACGFEGTKKEFQSQLPDNWIEDKKLTSTTTYLVAGDSNSNSSKAKTARKNGTEVITYTEALDKI